MQGRRVQFQVRKYRLDKTSVYYPNYPNYSFVETSDPPTVCTGLLLPDLTGMRRDSGFKIGEQQHTYEWTHQLITPVSTDIRGGRFGLNGSLGTIRVIPNELTGADAVNYPPPGVLAYADFWVEFVERYSNAFKRAYLRRVGQASSPSDAATSVPGNPPGSWTIQ